MGKKPNDIGSQDPREGKTQVAIHSRRGQLQLVKNTNMMNLLDGKTTRGWCGFVSCVSCVVRVVSKRVVHELQWKELTTQICVIVHLLVTQILMPFSPFYGDESVYQIISSLYQSILLHRGFITADLPNGDSYTGWWGLYPILKALWRWLICNTILCVWKIERDQTWLLSSEIDLRLHLGQS